MYAVLDIETTGGQFNEEGITEIAIHRFDGEVVIDQFISLVNPEREIQPYVANLTGINEKMIRTAPKFHEVAKRVVEITEDTVLVAHNAQFDYRILRTEFRRLGFEFERKTLCTIDLAKSLLPEAESYNLGKLSKFLGIPIANAHRANGDALATLSLFRILLDKDHDKSIILETMRDAANGELSKRHVDLLRDVPTDTGVYYLHNKYGHIIYIGYSKNLLKAVSQHLAGQVEISRKLRKDTRKVTIERTGNLMIAQLKWLEELDRVSPDYLSENPSFSTNGSDYHELLQDWNGKTFAIVDKGRQEGEKSVILIKNGDYKGFGYANLNHQINNIHILESVISQVEGTRDHLRLIASLMAKKEHYNILELNTGS